MATSTVASSPLHTKLSTLSFNHSPLPLPTHFSLKTLNPLKPLKLNTHVPASPLSLLFLPYFHCPSAAAFDSFEVAQDDNFSTQDDNPQAQMQEFEQDDDDDDDEELKPVESNDEAKLYVGNLPYSMTSNELSEVFVEAGRVVNAEIIYDRVTDRSRGFGFVTMGSVEEAKEAIRMFNGSQVGGRTVRVNFPEVPRGGEREVMGPKIRSSYKGFIDSPHKIYAGNLGWRLTSEGLRNAFADQPGVLSAKVIYERDSGRSRGFGFVSFESAADAEAALNAMNGLEVEGRPLRLNLAADKGQPLAIERTAENSIESSELLSSVGG